jgi:hypothetical protein
MDKVSVVSVGLQLKNSAADSRAYRATCRGTVWLLKVSERNPRTGTWITVTFSAAFFLNPVLLHNVQYKKHPNMRFLFPAYCQE